MNPVEVLQLGAVELASILDVRHLAQDLSRSGETFMSGTAEEFAVLVRWVEGHPRPRGFGALK